MDTLDTSSTPDADRVRRALTQLLADHQPAGTDPREFLGAQFDAGLAAVDFPVGDGGLGVDADLQRVVAERLYDAGAPNAYLRNPLGVGHVAPTLVAHGSPWQRRRFLRPMFTGEEIWCQLFSEPGAGSDLAGLSTRARRTEDGWRITGQKVWTSLAHDSRWGMLIARTNPDVAKHLGLTVFIVDMTHPGVTVRPLRQMTGDAEFNEVFLDEVVVEDSHRLGPVGGGWRVTITTLMNERVAMSGRSPAKGSGLIGEAFRLWHEIGAQDPVLRDRLAAAYSRGEAHRLTVLRAERAGAASPGAESAVLKLLGTEHTVRTYDLLLDLMGPQGLLYDDYGDGDRQVHVTTGTGLNAAGSFTADFERSHPTALTVSDLKRGYLRSRANRIEAGSSEVMRTVLAERVLGLPRETRPDRELPWSEVPRSAGRR
jgi:alkylation response protein AidB-like acyl-CoA dehydrogenase